MIMTQLAAPGGASSHEDKQRQSGLGSDTFALHQIFAAAE